MAKPVVVELKVSSMSFVDVISERIRTWEEAGLPSFVYDKSCEGIVHEALVHYYRYWDNLVSTSAHVVDANAKQLDLCDIVGE